MKKAKILAAAATILCIIPTFFSACNLFGGHTHKMTYVPALQPTCEETGMCEYWHCEKCGENFGDAEGTIKRGDTPAKARGHIMVNDGVEREPTCTEVGLKRMKCSREDCDHVEYQNINYLGHDFGDWEVTSATCAKDGKNVRYCKRDNCNGSEEEPIAATGNHKWADGEITEAATCTNSGTRTLKCLTCSETKSVEIPATGHSYETATVKRYARCNEEGEDELTCAICGHFETVKTPKKAHNFSTANRCSNCLALINATNNMTYFRRFGDDGSSYYALTSAKNVTQADVEIPAYYKNLPVREIEKEAFANNRYIESVNIPDTVTKIGADAFRSCTKLKKVIIGRNLKEITIRAFEGSPVKEIHVGELSTWCGLSGINGMLQSAKLYVGEEEVKDLVIPDGITKINYGTFMESSITSLHIGKDVSYISSGAFQNCTKLSRITVDSRNTSFRAENNCLIEIATNTVFLGCKNSFIPQGITAIGEYAFYCMDIECVTIPSSVTTIGSSAFSACMSLTSVNFENPKGWKCTRGSTSFELNEEELTDAATAAKSLMDTNSAYYWIKE